MEHFTEIGFFIEENIAARLRPYIDKSSAAGLGELILEALNFDLECNGAEPIKKASCVVRNRENFTCLDAAQRPVTGCFVEMKFVNDAHEIVRELAAQAGMADLRWLLHPLEAYADFLDQRMAVKGHSVFTSLSGGATLQ